MHDGESEPPLGPAGGNRPAVVASLDCLASDASAIQKRVSSWVAPKVALDPWHESGRRQAARTSPDESGEEFPENEDEDA